LGIVGWHNQRLASVSKTRFARMTLGQPDSELQMYPTQESLLEPVRLITPDV
jgi:hypothetical protein